MGKFNKIVELILYFVLLSFSVHSVRGNPIGAPEVNNGLTYPDVNGPSPGM